MTRALLFSLLLAACTPEDYPYPWFQNAWISDRDSTLEANAAFLDLDPEALAAFLSMYGQLRWKIDGFTIEAIYPEEPRFNLQSRFTIDAIDDRSFRLLTEVGSSFTISKNENGFCATPQASDETVECFVPFDS